MKLYQTLAKHKFLLEELVKRDFKKKYKRTVLGMGWSLMSPLLTLLMMKIIFTNFFGRTQPHYTTYLFVGILVVDFFSESTKGGITALTGNAVIFTKVNIPKYLFLISKNVQTMINFMLTLVVFFGFCIMDHITFSWRMLVIAYPMLTLTMFNLGLGLLLSALYVFFRDMQYLWNIILRFLLYGSAVFYTTDKFPSYLQVAFKCNPVYDHIAFVRQIVINESIPSCGDFLLLASFAFAAILVGGWMYKHYNTEFLYYV